MIVKAFMYGLAAMILTGCVAPGGPGGDVVKPAVSARPAESEEQQRAKVHTELGSLYLLDGRYAVALEEAGIALVSDPNYAPAYNLLGLTHMVLGQAGTAEENFRKAMRLAPGDPEISNNYGWFICQNGREQESLQYFLTAARNPLYTAIPRAYTNAGICAYRMNDFKAAENFLLSATALAPDSTLALFWLANVAYRTGRFAAARQWITDIERTVEPTAELLWLALRVERKLGSRDGETRYANQLRRRFPGSPEQRLLNQGQFE